MAAQSFELDRKTSQISEDFSEQSSSTSPPVNWIFGEIFCVIKRCKQCENIITFHKLLRYSG